MIYIVQSVSGAFGPAFVAVERQEISAPEFVIDHILEPAPVEIEPFLCYLVPSIIVCISGGRPAAGIELSFAVEEHAFVADHADVRMPRLLLQLMGAGYEYWPQGLAGPVSGGQLGDRALEPVAAADEIRTIRT